jgi:hypothetical protein
LNGNEVCEIASRLCKRNWSLLPSGRTLLFGTRGIDKLAELQRNLAMPPSGLVGSGLQRNRQELVVVAFNVALQERDQLLSGRHAAAIGRVRLAPSDPSVQIRVIVILSRRLIGTFER